MNLTVRSLPNGDFEVVYPPELVIVCKSMSFGGSGYIDGNPNVMLVNAGHKQEPEVSCLHPNCECLDYCEAADPYSTPKRKPQEVTQ